MKVILYESSSKGGCYEYARYLFRAFEQKGNEVKMIVPKGSNTDPFQQHKNIHKILIDDQKIYALKILAKVAFLWRQVYNPIRFICFLSLQPKSIVIWNDFEQLSAGIWVPLVKIFARKHAHAIVLHDPDRDNYPPSKAYSIWCMKRIMKSMDLALYHQYLPQKPYYEKTSITYLSIVHGVYDVSIPDSSLMERLTAWKQEGILLSILGNIREEKNYQCILESMKQLPLQYKLLIAGAAANSAVDIEAIQKFAKTAGLSQRIHWENKFLTDSELSACIQSSDIILLYYKPQFTSQSGVLNLLAPYKKRFVYTDSPSGLERVCKKHTIGVACVPDNATELARVIQYSEKQFEESIRSWDEYLHEADWIKIVERIQQWYQEYNK